MNFIDLFAGIGGFRLGLEGVGGEGGLGNKEEPQETDGDTGTNDVCVEGGGQPFRCVYSNEWDKYAAQIYKKNFGECDERDIRTINADEIPDHDLLCAGFPCQAFSVAGKRLGFEDTRGTLFFEIARILKHKRPRYFLLENVKGLLSHDKGKTFQTILGVLSDLGYGTQWQVLNSKHFGVPQNRERVFIIGHFRGKPRPKVFPLAEDDGLHSSPHGAKKRRSQAKLSSTIRGSNMKADHTFIIHNKYGGFGEKKLRKFTDYSPTIRTPKGGGHIPDVVEGMRIRRLTPIECERLQGFPDDWTEGVSDTQRYKCLGNVVTTNVVMVIGNKLKQEHLGI